MDKTGAMMAAPLRCIFHHLTELMNIDEIKSRLHSAIDLLTDDVLREADYIPLIVQKNGNGSGNSQSITIALYFDFRTINNGEIRQEIQ